MIQHASLWLRLRVRLSSIARHVVESKLENTLNHAVKKVLGQRFVVAAVFHVSTLVRQSQITRSCSRACVTPASKVTVQPRTPPELGRYATNRIMLNSYSMTFDGTLLERGFWLYVWDIRQNDDRYLYVGRTGDSSSANAASPFNRIGQHLDFRANAKGNALGKQLRRLNVQPSQCTFEMLAIGPIFPEQETFDLHKPIRDTVGALESALADELANRGYDVIGTHGRRVASDTEIWAEVLRHTNTKFPPLNVA